MRRIKTLSLLLVPVVAMLVYAPSALATTHGGEGIYGPTDDKIITTWMFGLLLFFPLVILVFSKIQSRLDKRKYARVAAEKARESSDRWKGGW
jgi:hypothetical protein